MIEPAPAPRRRGAVVRRIARTLVEVVYRDVDVTYPAEILPGGPIVAVANHFGGLSDGVLLLDCLPRMPRIVARDVIWQVPLLGQLATAAGLIPVHRSTDGGPGRNDAMFGAAYSALREGELLLIFPEGVTQDAPHLARLRTGAARIALGAAGAGVAGIRILPIGVHYEDKAGFRSRALVTIGEPIALDAWRAARSAGERPAGEDPELVHALTDEIDAVLRATAPDYPDWPTARALETAADVLLHDVAEPGDPSIRYGDRARLAGLLNRSAEPDRSRLVAGAGAYRADLRRLHTSDRTVRAAVGPGQQGRRRWLADLALFVLLLPFALAGLVLAALPLGLTVLASRVPVAPAVRATLIPGVALIAFGGEWLGTSWLALRAAGWQAGMAALLLFWFVVAALFLAAELAVLQRSRWRARRRPRGADLAALAAARADVADLAWRLL